MARGNDVKTPLCVAAYTRDLFVPREGDNGKESYQCTLIFKKGTDLSALQESALQAAVAEWGDKARDMLKQGVIRSPFLDGDGKQGRDAEGNPKPGFEGTTFIRCKSGKDYKPKIFDKRRNPVMDPADMPSGSQVYAVINPFTWSHPTNGKGITFGVSLVQVARPAEGDEILGGGGGPNPDKWLDVIDDEGDAPASTQGGAGASGLFG